MKVGVWRRIGSFLLDLVPIITILSLCFSLFAGDLLKPEDYDELSEAYQAKVTAYNDEVMPYYDQYTEGELTLEEYNEIAGPIEDSYFDNDETEAQMRVYLDYLRNGVLYYFIGINIIYFAYCGFTKENTLGRRLLKVELKGKINWWTILLRELIWKTGYWGLTLGAGIVVDFIMITFTKKKMCFRDMVSNIRVTYDGIEYPF